MLAEQLFTSSQIEVLKTFTKKYIWWKNTEESLLNPERIICQVMNIGTLEDASLLEKSFKKEVLIEFLKNSELGWLDLKSWNFWHLRFGLKSYLDPVPPLPVRFKNE